MDETVKTVMNEYSGKDIEGCLGRLAQIADEMEESDLKLEAAISLYQEGMVAVHRCNEILESAEQRVEVLKKLGDGGFKTEKMET